MNICPFSRLNLKKIFKKMVILFIFY
ncbi:hypothetical protein CY0110_18587 [Crocosphaera chwakensis CCY0110]|uniref:Uncharacterized protein n=1 Tax=Crocosphaera chwakensis CCY0110 TaxID=391612 RepID=A3IJ49_9CHRO|nr:hypothetical protein CY0110_18587 [Crocosphaera chwakensis CCY0110]